MYARLGGPLGCTDFFFFFFFGVDLKIHPRTGNYLPYFYVNDFWQLKEDFMPINSTVKQLDLFLDFAPISLMKWQLYTQLEQSFQMQASMGTTSDSETDEIRVRAYPVLYLFLIALCVAYPPPHQSLVPRHDHARLAPAQPV